MKTGIYVITCILNNKKYIGQSVDIVKRNRGELSLMKKGKFHSGNSSNRHMENALKKYGWKNFSFKVLEECKKDELNDKEKYWINLYHTNNSKYGYNLNSGGNGNRDYHQTLEAKNKMSKSKKIYFSDFKNRQNAAIRTKKYFSNLNNRNKSALSHNGIPFFSINFETKEIKQWISQTICAEELKINRESVGQCLRNTITRTGNYLFDYKKENLLKKCQIFEKKHKFMVLNNKTMEKMIFFSVPQCAKQLNLKKQYIERCLKGNNFEYSSKGYSFCYIDKMQK